MDSTTEVKFRQTNRALAKIELQEKDTGSRPQVRQMATSDSEAKPHLADGAQQALARWFGSKRRP